MKHFLSSLFLVGAALGQSPVVPVLNKQFANQSLQPGAVAAFDLSDFFGMEEIRDEAVRLTAEWVAVNGTAATAEIDFLLFKNRTPVTVDNFRGYVNRGDYTNMFVHRLVSNFVIQGGGFTVVNGADGRPMTGDVDKLTPIVNEFGISNTLATISMAKVGGNPDSATSEWFISTGANSDNLDNQNGGFTVFGRVSQGSFANAMALNDQDEFSLVNLGGALTSLPLVRGTTPATFAAERFYRFSSVVEVPLPAGQAGVSQDLTYSQVLLPDEGPLLTFTGEMMEVAYPDATRGGRKSIVVQAEDSVGNQVVDTFEVLLMADYEAWRRSVYSAAEVADDSVSGPLAMPNDDGVSNLILFSQGLSTERSASLSVTPPIFRYLEDSITVDIETAFITGLNWQLQASDSLEAGGWVDVDTVEVATLSATGQTVRLTGPEGLSSSPQRFFRIRYTLD